VDRAAYEDYLAKFNACDYAGFFAYYGEDPDLSFFGVTLRSLAEVERFYAFLHAHARETIRVTRFAANEELVAVEVVVRIEGLRTLTVEMLTEAGYPQLHPLAAGEVIEMEQMIHYRLRGGRIASVRCAILD
jgi:hypothetical protein